MEDLNLSLGDFGDEMFDLQRKLIQYNFDIPAAEVETKFFGPATHEAAWDLQEEHELLHPYIATEHGKATAVRRTLSQTAQGNVSGMSTVSNVSTEVAGEGTLASTQSAT